MKTRVPIERPWSAFDQSPSSLIVIRSQEPFGADEIEKGWARHQPSRVRNRQTKYWPERTASWSSSRPVTYIEMTPGASVTTLETRSRWRSESLIGSPIRNTRMRPNATTYSAHQ